MTTIPLSGQMVVNEHGLCCNNNGILIMADGITFTGSQLDWLLAMANALKTYKSNYPSEQKTDVATEFLFFSPKKQSK